ncbi:MAG: hypothetical protein QOG53_3127 [Frankiales bacterium]|jgi:hypothetical protein|nr:hypothetical protein [Frankiales bacterium]
MLPIGATRTTQSGDELLSMLPVLRRLVYADDRLNCTPWPSRLDPGRLQRLRAERECARADVAAKLLAFGWTPPEDEPRS